MAIKNVVLAGATGTVGVPIYEALVAAGHFNITILSRPDSKSTLPKGAKVIRYEYTDPALVDALRGQDAVICATNAAAGLTQIPLIDAAAKAGVKKFIPSEFGGDTHNAAVLALHPFYNDKKTVQDHVEKVALNHPGFNGAYLITGPFFAWGVQVGFLGYDLASHTATIIDGGSLPITYTDIPTVALAVVRILERDLSGFIRVADVTATQNQIVAALEKATGENWSRKDETTQNYYDLSAKLMKEEDPKVAMQGHMLRVLRIAYGEDSKPAWGSGDNEKLGIKERPLEELIRIALGKQ